MFIVRLQGGLGNQMFQYALYEKLRYRYAGSDVLLDKTSYRISKPHNGYELEDIFCIEPNYASDKEIWDTTGKLPCVGGRSLLSKNDLSHKILKRMFRYVNKGIDLFNRSSKQTEDFIIYQSYEDGYVEDADMYTLDVNQNWYFDGTWFNCDFSEIRNRLYACFALKKDVFLPLANQIHKEESVSIHVRRGDYANWNYMILDSSYYIKAIDYVKERIINPFFYVFSDEIDKIREEFSKYPNYNSKQFFFVDGNLGDRAYLDMVLMSMCKHNILANSTFSAAAELINQNINGIRIAPKFWMKDKHTWKNNRWLLL